MSATLPSSSPVRGIAADATGRFALSSTCARRWRPRTLRRCPTSHGGCRAVRDRRRCRGSERAHPRSVGPGRDARRPAGGAARARVERCDPGPANFVARLTVELLRPVPLVPLTVSARSLRPGKMVHWIEAILRAGDVEVARAVGLRLRTVADSPAAAPPAVVDLPGPETRNHARSRSAARARYRLLDRERHPDGRRHVPLGRARSRVAPLEGAGRRGRRRQLPRNALPPRPTSRAASATRSTSPSRPRSMPISPSRCTDRSRRLGRPRLARAWAQSQGTGMAEAVHPRPRRPHRPLGSVPPRALIAARAASPAFGREYPHPGH